MKTSTKLSISAILVAATINVSGNANAFLGLFEDDKNPLESERRTPVLNNASSVPPVPAGAQPMGGAAQSYGMSAPQPPMDYGMAAPSPQVLEAPLPPSNIPVISERQLSVPTMPEIPQAPQMPQYSMAYGSPAIQSPAVVQPNSYLGSDGYPKLSSIPQAPVTQIVNPANNARVAELKNDFQQSQSMMSYNNSAPAGINLPPAPEPLPVIAPAYPANADMTKSYANPMVAPAYEEQQQSIQIPEPPNFASTVASYPPQYTEVASNQPAPVFPTGNSVTVRSKRSGGGASFNPTPVQPSFTQQMPEQLAYNAPMPEISAPAPIMPEASYASAQPAPVFPSGPSVTVRSKRSGGSPNYNPAPVQPAPEQFAFNAPAPEVFSAPAPAVQSNPIISLPSYNSAPEAPQIVAQRQVSAPSAPMASSYDNPFSNEPFAVSSLSAPYGNSYVAPVAKHNRILPRSRYERYRKTGDR